MIVTACLLREATRVVSAAQAEYLLSAIMRLNRHLLYVGDTRVPAQREARFRALVRKAADGMPVQYLVHSAPFLDLDLYVDQRVFIPRPETEDLVLRAAELVHQPQLILDYGTGSGCIAIALARLFPHSEVVAVDSSPTALRVCRLNVRRYRLDKRIRLVQAGSLSDLQLRRLTGQVDLLISNPPYVPTERIPKLPPSVRNFEPHSALDGGRRGTSIVKMILQLGPSLLSPGGLMAIEIDSSHASFVIRNAPHAKTQLDLSGKTRYAFVHRPS